MTKEKQSIAYMEQVRNELIDYWEDYKHENHEVQYYDMAIAALKKQEPTSKNDLALIHTEGLDEEIRCTMCTNSMKSDRGCDGSCVVDKDMYKAVMDAIERRIQPTTKNDCETCIHNKGILECDMYGCKYEPTTKNNLSSGLEKNSKKLEKDFGGLDCISREQAQTEIEMNASRYTIAKERGGMGQVEWSDQLIKVSDAVDILRHLPSVIPQEPRWIPVSERLPEPNANDGLIARHYLIQNEYKDMLVARYDGEGWEQIYQYEYLEDDVIAWMPLPESYEPQESEETDI